MTMWLQHCKVNNPVMIGEVFSNISRELILLCVYEACVYAGLGNVQYGVLQKNI